jgi:hypothetical protein
MRHEALGALLCAALAGSTAAAAQNRPEAEAGPEIVVTGNRDMEGQLRDFVGALTQTGPGRQLARFETAICPAAVGVSPGQKEAIAGRLRQIAEAAGLAVRKGSCTPNVLLVVTADKAGFLDALWKSYPEYFGDMSASDVRRLGRTPGPAAAWHVDGPPLSADGVKLADGGDGAYVNRTGRVSSRITAGVRPQFAAAAVVVEARALEGLTTTQIADYAAMRAFARGDPSRLPGSAPTILKVLEAPMGAEVPITLTSWDLAFLRSLYSGTPNTTAAAQRTSIRKGVEGRLRKGEADK